MRKAHRLLASVAALALLVGALTSSAIAGAHGDHARARSAASGRLPVDAIQDALHAKGKVGNDGVLTIGIERDDINNVTLHGVPIKPSFEINGELDFQPLSNGRAFFNGDLALKPGEIDHVIDAILSNGLVFQAEHQHLYDFSPMVWFIHIRGKGDPVKLAHALYNVLKATSTPLPQAPPEHPTTPLNPDRLKSILHGFDVEVGNDGVVTVYVARRNPIFIDGVRVNPATNIATNVAFEPLNSSGSETAVVPDFGMEASEVDPVISTMRAKGWDIGCLYNQETDEHPQLFFSHNFKVGDPYVLAQEVRDGLAAARVRHRRQHLGRLVERQVDQAWLGRDALAVHPDHLAVGIDPRAEPPDDLTVHRDPARADELLAVPAAADPGLSQDLLQPDPARDVGQ